MDSPLDAPEGNWWNRDVNRRESIWLGLSAGWAVLLFGWMAGWTQVGNQNPVGPTTRMSTDEFQSTVSEYKSRGEETTVDGEEGVLVPPDADVYVGAMRFNWDGLPVVLERGTEYDFHLGSYDVQHGFSIREGETLSKQMSLQVLPGYEWVMPMSFDETGTYHVVCNEFCGTGHRTMHGKFYVR